MGWVGVDGIMVWRFMLVEIFALAMDGVGVDWMLFEALNRKRA